MASIRKRNDKWQVQVRRTGFPTMSRSFSKKSDAAEWARHWEANADRNELPPSTKVLNVMTLEDLVRRYRDEIVPKKRSAEIETIILNAFLRDPICRKTLSTLTTADFAAYRDHRLAKIAPKSLARQLSPLSNMFTLAEREWGLRLRTNPLSNLSLHAIDQRRNRRLRDGEFNQLFAASKRTRNHLIWPIVLFALETAMRRGEILAMRWEDVDFRSRSLSIPLSKNGQPRVIPLTVKTIKLLKRQSRLADWVFPVSANALRLAWRRMTQRAGLVGLHFHDLRHEAISRYFERGLTLPEVASISGHRDVRMLLRYAHHNSETVRWKLK